MNIPDLANGRMCEIRVPGGCAPRETTVFCHVRCPDISGAGFKAPDWLGAFGCSRCHDIVDGRAGSWIEWSQKDRDLMLAEGAFRTLMILTREGVIDFPEPQRRRPKLSKIVPRRLPESLTEAERLISQENQ